jgi:hypothetical protein
MCIKCLTNRVKYRPHDVNLSLPFLCLLQLVVFQCLCPPMLWPAHPSVVATHLHRFACIDVVPESDVVVAEKNIKNQMVFGFSISNHKVVELVVLVEQGCVHHNICYNKNKTLTLFGLTNLWSFLPSIIWCYCCS